MSGKYASGDGNRRTNNQREECELESRRVSLENDAAHGRLEFEGLTQVTAEQLSEIVCVLGVKREIQAERMTQLYDLPGGRAFPKHLLHGIARYDVNHQKDERKDEPERGKRQQESFEEVASHL
jgi:hypothetical protein